MAGRYKCCVIDILTMALKVWKIRHWSFSSKTHSHIRHNLKDGIGDVYDILLYFTITQLCSVNPCMLLYKVEWFIDFSATNRIDSLASAIVHVKLTCVDYHETHYRPF